MFILYSSGMEQIFYHNNKKRAYDDSFLPEKPSLTKRENYGTMGLRGCGGTGRHKGLKIPRSKIRTGSIPATSLPAASGGGKGKRSECSGRQMRKAFQSRRRCRVPQSDSGTTDRRSVNNSICRCGGTGRHKGLKIPRSKIRTGSIPVSGTTIPTVDDTIRIIDGCFSYGNAVFYTIESYLCKGGAKMKNRNWNFLVYVHGSLLLWALLLALSLSVPDGGKTAGVLAAGNALILFVNIPLAVFSFVLKAKGRFDLQYERFAIVLSILNLIIGIAAWLFVLLLLKMP